MEENISLILPSPLVPPSSKSPVSIGFAQLQVSCVSAGFAQLLCLQSFHPASRYASSCRSRHSTWNHLSYGSTGLLCLSGSTLVRRCSACTSDFRALSLQPFGSIWFSLPSSSTLALSRTGSTSALWHPGSTSDSRHSGFVSAFRNIMLPSLDGSSPAPRSLCLLAPSPSILHLVSTAKSPAWLLPPSTLPWDILLAALWVTVWLLLLFAPPTTIMVHPSLFFLTIIGARMRLPEGARLYHPHGSKHIVREEKRRKERKRREEKRREEKRREEKRRDAIAAIGKLVIFTFFLIVIFPHSFPPPANSEWFKANRIYQAVSFRAIYRIGRYHSEFCNSNISKLSLSQQVHSVEQYQ
ncbi:hypothetical protein PO909_020795 [Leuciscus waleckii]